VPSQPAWSQVLRYLIVGGLGVGVNMITMVVLTQAGPPVESVVVPIAFTEFNVRFYHLFSTAAFVVANLVNYVFNRVWTFRSQAKWAGELQRFFLTGLGVQLLGLGVLTLLMHPDSALRLSTDVFDGSHLLRTRVYWAQLITIAVVTPLSYAVNTLWTFRK